MSFDGKVSYRVPDWFRKIFKMSQKTREGGDHSVKITFDSWGTWTINVAWPILTGVPNSTAARFKKTLYPSAPKEF